MEISEISRAYTTTLLNLFHSRIFYFKNKVKKNAKQKQVKFYLKLILVGNRFI